MLLKALISRYRQLGGWKVVRFYAGMGVVWPMVKAILHNPFIRQSYKLAYSLAIQKVEPFLRDKYSPMMAKCQALYSGEALIHQRSNIVWFCWLQGLDNAPLIVKVCYASIQKHLKDREIRVIDEKNWRDYVELPDYVLKRWENKQMPPALFSDLLRLQLLIKHGGTWMDATILCTGFDTSQTKETLEFFDVDLFMFQYTQPGSFKWGGIGNWFITSCTNNVVLMSLRDMLYSYWKDYDCTLDYYILHLFFTMLREEYPSEIASMPYGYAVQSVALGYNLGKQYNPDSWNRLISKVSIHKLTYKVKEKVLRDKDNYYYHILSQYEV